MSFDADIYDQTHDVQIRQHEFASLDISSQAPRPETTASTVVVVSGAKAEKLAGGFFNISGGAVDSRGGFYFVDAHRQRIYRWDSAKRQLSTNDVSISPVNIAVDRAGNLMVVSDAGNGTVYAVDAGNKITPLKPQPMIKSAGKNIYLPVSDWHLNRTSLSHPTGRFVSPDGTTVLPVGQDFLDGETSWGVKSSPPIRSFGLGRAVPGEPFYVADESHLRTWKAAVNADGSLTDFQLFAEVGAEGVTTDSRDNVYIAAGEIHVFDPAGKPIGTIEVPERPTQLLFGGKDKKTLFIAARSSLYSVQMKYPGK